MSLIWIVAKGVIMLHRQTGNRTEGYVSLVVVLVEMVDRLTRQQNIRIGVTGIDSVGGDGVLQPRRALYGQAPVDCTKVPAVP